MRVVIVDDNEIEQLNLLTLLETMREVQVVGQATDLASAKALIVVGKPDAIFLDVALGRETGFDLLEELVVKPLVVFTTLHQEYAVKAFEVKAVDYLVKPITKERLRRAVDRLAGALAHKAAQTALDLTDLLVFKKGAERYLVAVESIAAICGDRDYTQVVTAEGKEYLDDRRMRDWQTLLPGKYFPALDRSTIVNLGEVASYHPTSEGGALNWRNSPKPLEIGKAAFKRLEECMRHGVEE
ncbi:LytTR family DNA-binding domain-containing protein [soil metagenome]